MRKFFTSINYALEGFGAAWKSERNIRIQVVGAIAIVIASWWLASSMTDFLFIAFVLAMVIGIELINTAIEKLSDVVSPQYDKRIKVVKDISAASVTIIAVVAIFVIIAIIAT